MRHVVDRRVFGAVRCVDAVTGETVPARNVRIEPAGSGEVLVRPTRRGWFAVESVSTGGADPGLDERLHGYRFTFDRQPTTVPTGSVVVPVTVRGPVARFVPRTARLELPRRDDPNAADAVFQPIDIALFPSPSRVAGMTWAVVRVRVAPVGADSDDPGLPHAVVLRRQVANGGAFEVAATADARGEALVAIAGLPRVSTSPNGGGSPLSTTVGFELLALTDTAVGDPATPIDPDDLLRRHTAATLPVGQVRPRASAAAVVAFAPGVVADPVTLDIPDPGGGP